MDRPYDDAEVLGMTDVEDGTPIPKGMGAGASNETTSGPRARGRGTPPRDETFASGDQAAASARPSGWLDELSIQARREPLVTLAIAAGAGLIAGLLLGR